jgi:hypothetical protein
VHLLALEVQGHLVALKHADLAIYNGMVFSVMQHEARSVAVHAHHCP